MDSCDTEAYLRTPADWESINEMGHRIFKDGHFELLDDFLILVMPIVHAMYCRHIMQHDDRAHAREDILQFALMELYHDMKFRWDKYIEIDNYSEYLKIVVRNLMIGSVYSYHDYYNTVEYDPELGQPGDTDNSLLLAENKMVIEGFYQSISDRAIEFASYRVPYSKIVQMIVRRVYIEKRTDLGDIRTKIRVLGLSRDIFKFLIDHSYYVYRLAYNYAKAELKGNTKMITRLIEVINRMKDPTYEVLSRNYSDTIIPEIYAEFGEEITQRFVKTFSGRQVSVPSFRDFNDDMLGGVVYEVARGNKDNLREFSETYNLPLKSLYRIYDRAASLRKIKK